jgi:hypothetical protein
MTQDEIKRVKKYLYSIKAYELAILNLNKAIEHHTGRYEAEMRITTSISLAPGGESGSKVELWAEFSDTYNERLDFLEHHLKLKQERIDEYNSVMEILATDGHWGNLAAQIVRHKYYQHIHPDRAIYTMFLFCAERTFYQSHRRMLQFFYDTLPHRFTIK